MSFVQADRNPEKLEQLLKRAEEKEHLSAEEIEELSEEYQSWCQFYGYLQTVAPGSGLSRRGLSSIQRGRALIYGRGHTVRETFLKRLPKAYQTCAPYIFVSFSFGILSALLAGILIFLRPALAWTLLSEETIEALNSGHLWTEQLQGAGILASTSILKNNITVTFSAFALGLTGGIGTLAVLIFNGAHLGGMFAAVHHYHMSDELLNFITAHGPLELSIIFVTGGAGLAVGDSILHPGDLPTKESLKLRANEAFELVILGAIGLFFCGFIEGLISPKPYIPLSAKVIVGILAATIYWSILISGLQSPFVRIWRLRKKTNNS